MDRDKEVNKTILDNSTGKKVKQKFSFYNMVFCFTCVIERRDVDYPNILFRETWEDNKMTSEKHFLFFD